MPRLTKKQKEDNEARASRGWDAIETYRTLHGQGEPFETALTDLLADLMHYAAENKIDFAHRFQTAQMHYNAEKNGEG